jgi:hypothetical protein
VNPPRGGNVHERPVTPADLLATIYQVLEIPLDIRCWSPPRR